MGLARRQFLQSLAAGFLGWQFGSRDSLARAAELYGKKVAQPTKRKLALLIGINQYDAKGNWLPLNGCVTDVELQQELLIHRFGFNPKDILTLVDQQATRTAIAEAVNEHLIAQALPGDVVVLHFSGHGSRIGDRNTLVPVDSGIPSNGEFVNDIPDETLWNWLEAIGTDRVTCILDAGYVHPGTPVVGNFRIRARPGRRDWQIDPHQINFTSASSASAKARFVTANTGIVLQAASQDRLCADASWPGFSSGVFTYALTQQLWQMTPATSLQVVVSNVLSTLEQEAFPAQNLALDKQLAAHIEGKPQQPPNVPTYFSVADAAIGKTKSVRFNGDLPSADGVIRTVASDRKAGEIWLAGLPISSLGYYGIGSILAVTDLSQKDTDTLVQVRSHNGLTAKVEAVSGIQLLQAGQLLQERVRAVPRNLSLIIALDLGLSKIERVDATSALSALPHMTGINATEQFADCVFGCHDNSYGLFTVGHTPILASFGPVGESVGTAIRRLQPQLEGLLAAKIIRLTANQGSSCIGLKAAMSLVGDKKSAPIVLASNITRRAEPESPLSISSMPSKCLSVGDRLVYTLENLTERPLYLGIFIFDPRGRVMTPSFAVSPYASDNVIPARQKLDIPSAQAPFNWLVSAPQGLVDIQIVASHSPLTQTLNLIEQNSRQATSPTGMLVITSPLQVARALLSDLHRPEVTTVASDDTWLLDVENWATLGFSYHVA